MYRRKTIFYLIPKDFVYLSDLFQMYHGYFSLSHFHIYTGARASPGVMISSELPIPLCLL